MIKKIIRTFIRFVREDTPTLKKEYSSVRFAGHALQKIIDEHKFTTVLDIGSGGGEQADIFVRSGKQVTAVDYGESCYFKERPKAYITRIGDFNKMYFDTQFDCVWASHVLEHQLDVQEFLTKIHSVLREGGTLAITVPPLKHDIVGGHVSLWNAGLLLYRLVLAGFDCSNVSVLSYGYNISVVVKKKTINVPELVYDKGDVDKISRYLPGGLKEGFNGDIYRLNW